jgi:hypothetical protein
MDPQRVLALCHEHAGAEAVEDVERVLATLVAEPVFEFFPLCRKITGRANIEKFYREQYPVFAKQVLGYAVIGEWTNEIAAVQEYTIDVAETDGRQSRYYVISMMPGDDATGLLTGERLYCDEGFVRALLGPLFDRLQPITA